MLVGKNRKKAFKDSMSRLTQEEKGLTINRNRKGYIEYEFDEREQ